MPTDKMSKPPMAVYTSKPRNLPTSKPASGQIFALFKVRRGFQVVLTAMGLAYGGLVLTGCASKPNVGSRSYTGPVPTYYTVRRGDTVSKIARRYGLNWRAVSRLNNLDASHTIYVNQRLRLKGAAPAVSSRGYQNNSWQSRSLPSKPVQPNKPAPANTFPAYTQTAGWFRPARGQIFQTFNPQAGVKGIRFAGNQGDPVFASQAGEVIYASDGLKEYGNLVLLRHTGGYISAYAHNERLLVKEGERVATGKQIATLGSTGASRNMLEFQIRKDGKPIDPMAVMNP